MLNYFPEIYRQLETEIDSCIAQNTHLLIITLPGLGATHLLQHYLSNHQQNHINYINLPDQNISDTYNFLDVQFNQIENYFTKANYQQKFAVVVNQPYFLQSPEYLNSTLPKRFLKTFYLGTFSQKDIEIFLKTINPNISQIDADLIYKLSGGITRLAKFFCTNIDLIQQDLKNIVDNPVLYNIISPTISAMSKTDTNTLQKLNIDTSSPILSHFLKNTQKNINIKINFDLTFNENNILNSNSLNKIESQILKYIIDNDGQISREKIAEFKWGQNSYDNFSDLAITKTMRRLKHKLNIYTLKTIPKTGYVITKI